MTPITPKYVRDGDEIYAFVGDRCIAHGSHFAAVEQTATDYLDHVVTEDKAKAAEAQKASATHVTSPNGLKGEILSNVDGVWGNELTVRWENGRIAKYHAHEGFEFTKESAEPPKNALEYLEGVLNTEPEHDKQSLFSRITSLDEMIIKASNVINTGVSLSDERKIDQLVVAAEYEKREVKEALDHLEQADAESFSPPAPFSMGVAEQADLGPSSNWLDETVGEMVAETEGQNFDKMLDEEPGLFVADIDTGALGDAGIVGEMALSHIVSKTAGLRGEKIEEYRKAFVAKTELARRRELADRTTVAKEQFEKTAKTEEQQDLPDDALFLQ